MDTGFKGNIGELEEGKRRGCGNGQLVLCECVCECS